MREPEGERIDRSPDGTPDEALDFLRTSIDAPFGGIPLLTGQSGVGKHGIFGGDPAPFFLLFLHPTGDIFLDGDPTNHPRLSPFDQGGTCRMWGNMILKANGSELVWAPILRARAGSI